MTLHQVRTLKITRKLPSFAQLQQFPHILSSQERRLFFGGVGLFVLGIILLLLGTVSTLFVPIPRSGGTLTEGILGYPQLINPLYADANAVDRELARLIYSGLLAFNPQTQTLDPLLAESYSLSEDEKTYTVVLKQGVTWHDNEPFRAQDVLFTFSALQNAAYGSPLFEAYQGITVAQVDDRTLTFTLLEPYAAFPELLSVGILPAHLWEEISPANTKLVALNLKPVGTGPYFLQKTSKDSRGIIRSVSLSAWNAFAGERPYLEEITVKFFSTTTDIIQALQTKRIDSTGSLSLSEALSLQEDRALAITALPLSQYVGAFFNTQKEALAEADMRRALTLALDVPAITADATGGLAIPLGFALPGFSPTAASVQDVQTAEHLLDELGYPRNEDGKRTDGDTALSLTIATVDRREFLRAAEQIAAFWQAIGITVQITTLHSTDMVAALKEKTYDVLIAAEQYGIIADPYLFWHSSGKEENGLNMSQFSTPETDGAVSTLRTSSSLEKRASAFATLSETFIDQMPAVFLFQNVLPLTHTVDIMGITAQPIPTPSSRWILESSWYKRTGLAWKF